MSIPSAAADTCTACVILPTIALPNITLPGLPNLDLSIMLSAMPALNLVLPVITIPTDPNAIPNYVNQITTMLSNWPSLPSIAITPFMQSIKFPFSCPSFNLALGGISFPFPTLSGQQLPTLPSFPSFSGITWPSLPALPGLPNSPYSVSIGKWMMLIGTFVATPFLMCQDILTSLKNLSLQMPTVAGVTAKITGFFTQLGFNVPALPALGKMIGCFATSIVALFHQVLGV